MPVPYLPPEIVSNVIKAADRKDLPNLRLVCRDARDFANDSFAIEYFRERDHVVSSYSITALLDIVMHPLFGRHVDIISINTIHRSESWPKESSYEQPRITDDEFIKSGSYESCMTQILGIIKTHHRKNITIGINDDEDGSSFGWRQLFGDQCDYRVSHAAGTLIRTLIAAQMADVAVEGLIVSLHKLSLRDSAANVRSLQNAIYRYFKYEVSIPTVNITLGHPSTNLVSYHDPSGSYTMSKVQLTSSYHLRDFHNKYQRVAEQNIPMTVSRLEMYDCGCPEPHLIWENLLRYHAETLKSVTLRNVTLAEIEDWELVVEQLSDMPLLEYCCVWEPGFEGVEREEGWEGTIIPRVFITYGGEAIHFIAKGDNVSLQIREFAALMSAAMDADREAYNGWNVTSTDGSDDEDLVEDEY